MKDIAISVIIPVYNSSMYIEECINSLLNQTISNFEIICIDDGSEDNSAKLIERYSKQHDNVILIRQNHSNAGEARNVGMKYAKGEYVIFLDSDDLFDKYMLGKIYTKAIETDSDIVLFKGKPFDTIKNVYGNDSFLNIDLIKKFCGNIFSSNDIPDYIFTISNPAPWTKFFKKSFIEHENIKFQSIENANDLLFTMTAMAVASSITYINESLIIYRKHNNSLQSSLHKNQFCFIDAYIALYEELINRNIFNKLQRSWINLTISGCIHNTASINDKQLLLKIYRELADRIFNIASLLNHPDDYYTNLENTNKLRSVNHILYYSDLISKISINPECRVILKAEFQYDPLISIIVPVYNAELYLKQCLDSIIGQSFKDFEVICVDDGSTDNSLNILLNYANKDSRITVCTQSNSGLSITRNQAVKYAIGRYICFIDSDDFIDNDFLYYIYCKIQNELLDVILFNISAFPNSEIDIPKTIEFNKYYHANNIYDGISTGPDLAYKLVNNNDYLVSACTKVIRRQFFLDNNLWFIPKILHEDNAFTFKLFLYANKVVFINKYLYNRRIHSKSIMGSDKTFNNILGYFFCYLDMYNNLDKFDNSNKFNLIPFIKILTNLLNIIKREYFSLDIEEQYSYLALPECKQFLFKLFILDSKSDYNYKKKIDKLNKDNQYLKESIFKIKSSYTWRIGRFAIWPLRNILFILRQFHSFLTKHQ